MTSESILLDLPSPPADPPPAPAIARPRADWVEVASGMPYFVDSAGRDWTPIGQNDSIIWPDLAPLYRRKNPAHAEGHLRWLKDHGVNTLRLMLEYAQVKHRRYRHIERPFGRYPAAMVQFWDDLFALCERLGLKILLTPIDTFWTWLHWKHHPYNRANGGPLRHPSEWLTCRDTRAAIKDRFSFAVTRWGGSGALFAWDLWNEIHPAQGGDSADGFGEFIHDLSRHVTALETRLFGRTHPKTVSLFGPELIWRPEMGLAEPIFRHPDLDFASIHIYETGTIDDPPDTVAPAIGTGNIVRAALAEITDRRPFFDSEHGPIHAYKDKHITLPEPFDDEYFRHMQWAHLASGGAGGGMRWPNRKPHVLTHGMRRAQGAMARFLPLIDWQRFARVNRSAEIAVDTPDLARFACADDAQAVVWLLRTDTIGAEGMLRPDARPVAPMIGIPGLRPGRYRITAWDTATGAETGSFRAENGGDLLAFPVPAFARDLALAVRRER